MAYLAIGVDLEGRKHALGVWIQDSEGAKFWQKVVIDLRNRGVRDILIACCDGLTGLPDAIRSIYPDTEVHVIRNAMRFVSYKDRKKVATSMRAIYTAPTVDAAELALKDFDTAYGAQYPGAIDVWRNAWPEFVPFLGHRRPRAPRAADRGGHRTSTPAGPPPGTTAPPRTCRGGSSRTSRPPPGRVGLLGEKPLASRRISLVI